MALAASLQTHDPGSVLWVLALDEFTTDFLRDLNDSQIKVVALPELEAADEGLKAAKSSRTTVEYFFTLSPCWPRYLLHTYPALDSIIYLDADMYWFASPAEMLAEWSHASILITEHRHPAHLEHHQRYGRFNVGLLGFRNDDVALACLDWWRDRCLEWCHDRLENGRYADQKYLDEWPSRYGSTVQVVDRPGINLAPWNWSQYHYEKREGHYFVEGRPVELFHFARFRPTRGTWWFQSGHLEYGVMTWQLRQYFYGNYWRALCQALARVRELRPNFDLKPRSSRGWHQFWHAIVPRLLFGSDWLRIGPFFISGRFGLGRYSGQLLSWTRSHLRNHVRRPLSADSRPPLPLPAAEDTGGGDSPKSTPRAPAWPA